MSLDHNSYIEFAFPAAIPKKKVIKLLQIETLQTENLSQLNTLINEVIEQRKVIDIKLSPIVFQEKILYTALVMFED